MDFKYINEAWDQREALNPDNVISLKSRIDEVLDALDCGALRVAEKDIDGWVVNEPVKKAILLYFKLNASETISGGPGGATWYDKVASKFQGWHDYDFLSAKTRAVPGSIVRRGAYIGPHTVLMPSFVNIGAYVDEGTLIDTWVTIGSCAQIGKNCHISGGVGIGGVLEPLQANPVIIEDNCFIGARSEIAEGVIVEEGSVLSMGVYIGASTKVIDRETGQIYHGHVPAYSVVVPGTLPGEKANLYCAVIVKKVDEKTRSKTAINEILRDI